MQPQFPGRALGVLILAIIGSAPLVAAEPSKVWVADQGDGAYKNPVRWIGAKVGIFALATRPAAEFGYADFDGFKVE